MSFSCCADVHISWMCSEFSTNVSLQLVPQMHYVLPCSSEGEHYAPVHRGLSSPNILTWQRLGQLSNSTNSPLLPSPHTHTWLYHTQCLCRNVIPFAPYSWLERPLSHVHLGEASYFSRLALVWISDVYCSLMNVYPYCHHLCQPSWNT